MKPSEQLDKDGRKLPFDWRRTLDRLVSKNVLVKDIEDCPPRHPLTNPYSGVEVLATPLCAALVHVILTEYNGGFTRLSQTQWNHLRYTVNVCWPEVYYAIVD